MIAGDSAEKRAAITQKSALDKNKHIFRIFEESLYGVPRVSAAAAHATSSLRAQQMRGRRSFATDVMSPPPPPCARRAACRQSRVALRGEPESLTRGLPASKRARRGATDKSIHPLCASTGTCLCTQTSACFNRYVSVQPLKLRCFAPHSRHYRGRTQSAAACHIDLSPDHVPSTALITSLLQP
jgi:hypothetical protein